jgi:hypothetical protein
MLHLHVKAEVIEPVQREQRAKRADRRAQFRPLGTGAFEQRYFVFGEEDEVAVRVRMRSEIAFFCCRAEVSERFQSSLVIVLKTGALFRAGEGAALDAGDFSGEDIEHAASADAMRTVTLAAHDSKGFLRGKYSSRKFVAVRRVSLAEIGRNVARSPPLSSSHDRQPFAVGEDRAHSAARTGSEAAPALRLAHNFTPTNPPFLKGSGRRCRSEHEHSG